MGRSILVILLVLVVAFIGGFVAFPYLPAANAQSGVPRQEVLGDDNELTWTWDESTDRNHPLSNLELQRALNFLKARFGFDYDWIVETGELYPGGSGSEFNRNYWRAVRASKELAFIPSYENLDGAQWTRDHAGDRLFSPAYFDFLTEVVKMESKAVRTDGSAIPLLDGAQRSGGATALTVESVTPRATVFANGRRLGTSPIQMVGLPPDTSLRIGVYRNGYYSLEKWVTVRDGEMMVLSPKLSRMPWSERVVSYTEYLLQAIGLEEVG
jgi:hypothetical protein